MPTFRVRLKCDEEFQTIDSFCEQTAAQDFAEWAYFQLECFSLGDKWQDKYAVLVVDENGQESLWNITVEAEPVFTASEAHHERHKAR